MDPKHPAHPPALEDLMRRIEERVPASKVDVEGPDPVDGAFFLTIAEGEQLIVVEFSPTTGFTFSSPSHGYGDEPDESCADAGALVRRLVEYALSGETTNKQRGRMVRLLRLARGLSQAELATRMGIKQPTLSRVESTLDVSLNMLLRAVSALGGQLSLAVQFEDERLVFQPSPHPTGRTTKAS